jgi:hypothetical protein
MIKTNGQVGGRYCATLDHQASPAPTLRILGNDFPGNAIVPPKVAVSLDSI